MTEFREAAPGPWELKERDDCSGFALRDADGSLIEYLNESRYVDQRHDPVHLESIALMADALEMRDALAELRRHAESNGTTPPLHDICKRVDALLARHRDA
jgi:hypothetical protein